MSNQNPSDGKAATDTPRSSTEMCSNCSILKSIHDSQNSCSSKRSKLLATEENMAEGKLAILSEADSFPAKSNAMRDALAIDHILELILSNLKINDLLKTRLLTRRFNSLSCTKIEPLLTFNLQVLGYLERPPNYKTLVSPRRLSESRGTLEEFLFTLSTATRFPCTKFDIILVDILDRRVQSFFTLQGCYIRSMYLSIKSVSQETRFTILPNQLANLLMESLPNLQNLKLFESAKQNYFNISEHIFLPPYKKCCLPNLKTLTVLKALRGIVEMLLNAAINLEEYSCVKHDYMSYFTQNPGDTRLHLIKQLFIVPDEDNLNILEPIAELLATKKEFQVRVLHLQSDYIRSHPHYWPRVSIVLNKILFTLSNTVEEIHMEPIRFLPDVQLPVFSKVRKLKLLMIFRIFQITNIEEYFPVGFDDISSIFPILQVFAVCLVHFPSQKCIFNSDINSSVWKPLNMESSNLDYISYLESSFYNVYGKA